MVVYAGGYLTQKQRPVLQNFIDSDYIILVESILITKSNITQVPHFIKFIFNITTEIWDP